METIESIAKWQRCTFGIGPSYALFLRTLEEVGELSQALRQNSLDGTRVCDEAADVIITLIGLLNCYQKTDAVDKKMEVNRQRVWKRNNDGTGYHVKTDKLIP